MIYSIAGLTAHTKPIEVDGELRGYTVVVNGETIGNRIDREASEPPLFTSVARNELPIATHETLHDAVADVVNEGMRDKARG